MIAFSFSGVDSTFQHYENQTAGMKLPGQDQRGFPMCMGKACGGFGNKVLPSSSGE